MKHFLLGATLASTALLGGTTNAWAQSAVTLYGLIDASVGSNKAPGGARLRGVDSGKMTTSYLGFSATEDLGGGLSAVVKMEHFLRVDNGEAGRFNGDAFWARNAYVGLSSKSAGTVTLGRNTTPLFVSTLRMNAFGDSFGYSPSIRHFFASGTVTGDTGWSDSMLYTSPRWAGFSFALIGALGEGSNGRNWGANAGYAEGPAAATVTLQSVKKDGATAVADTRTWQLGGSYDFGAAKLFGQYGRVKNETVVNQYRITEIGTKVPMGAGAALAQWGRIQPDTGARRDTLSLGYDHTLTKRTDVYAVAMRDHVANLSTGLGYSLGVRHRF
ncbi:porin [Sphaerotilus sp.]|uniref:porin n=1 Tax=Sphaerotilus sp. TaxID=2093942 RepID=UPI0025E468A3|nr:porin [Sphaerotilus sp.]